MKFSGILLLPFVALITIGTPTPGINDELVARTGAIEADGSRNFIAETNKEATAGAATDANRAVYAVVTANNVRYRRCASTSCEAIGQYHRGQGLTLTCYTYGENINGNK